MSQNISVNRTSMEIIHEILKLKGRKKTDIMYRAALTYPQTIRFLELLKTKGLISVKQDAKGDDVFEATEKGRQLLEHLSAVIGALSLPDDPVLIPARAPRSLESFHFIGSGQTKQGRLAPVSERHDEALAEDFAR